MRDFSKLKTALEFANNFTSGMSNEKLAKCTKEKVLSIMEEKPDVDLEYVLLALFLSARDSYKPISEAEDVDMCIDLIINYINDEDKDVMEENEEIILRELLKHKITSKVIDNSFNISLNAALEVWNGINGTGF